jgi:hypothetical protein
VLSLVQTTGHAPGGPGEGAGWGAGAGAGVGVQTGQRHSGSTSDSGVQCQLIVSPTARLGPTTCPIAATHVAFSHSVRPSAATVPCICFQHAPLGLSCVAATLRPCPGCGSVPEITSEISWSPAT